MTSERENLAGIGVYEQEHHCSFLQEAPPEGRPPFLGNRDLYIQGSGLQIYIVELLADSEGRLYRRALLRSAFTKAERRQVDALIEQLVAPNARVLGACAINNPNRPRTLEAATALEALVRRVESRSGLEFWRD